MLRKRQRRRAPACLGLHQRRSIATSDYFSRSPPTLQGAETGANLMKNNPPLSKRGGARPGAGRKKGVPNKLTTQLKDMILQALDEAHPKGSIAYLKEQASLNPTAFMTLVGKVLPLQVNAEHSGEVVAHVVFKGLNEDG